MPSSTPRNSNRTATEDVVRMPVRMPSHEPEVDDGVDLRQLWATIRERKVFVGAVGICVFVAVMLHTLLSPMTFRSSGRLYLGELEMRARTATGSAGQVDISGAAQGDIGSEIEILKSQSLVTKAILDSGLNVDVKPDGYRPPRLWQWLLGRRKPQLLDVPAREIRVVETALQEDALGSKSFHVVFDTSDAYQVVDEHETTLAKGVLGTPTQLRGLSGFMLLAGNEGRPLPGARFHVTVQPLDAVTDATLGALTVTAPSASSSGGEGAKVVMLEFSHHSPNAAATFLRELMRGYLGERQTWKTEDASAAETFVGQQLQSLRQALDATQKRLADYRSTTQGVVHQSEANALIGQVGRYEEQRVQARLQVASLQEMKRVLKQPNPPPEAFLVGESQDSVLEGLSASLSVARQQHHAALEQHGSESPQAQQARGRVEAQLDTIRNYVNSRLARAQENLSELDKVIAQFDSKLRSVPGAEFGLAQLGRESEVYSRVYSYMLERQQQAAIIKASTVSKNRILDRPKVPYREHAPRLGLRAASLPIGLLLGALLVIVQRLFATSFQSEVEIRRLVGTVPVFARIPRRDEGAVWQPESGLDPFREPYNPAYAEAFRTLRTNIYLDVQSDVGKVILVTSPAPGDGKTSSVLALAGTLAADDRRVCVVDADLRKPSHDALVSESRRRGLREILAGAARWPEVVDTVALSAGRIDSIAAGQRGPAEVLSGERMGRFLSELRTKYDYILLDCASFPVVADPLVLTPLADCVLTVLRVRNTPQDVAAEHLRRLSSAARSYGVLIQDLSQAGVPYPVRRKPKLRARLLRQLEEIRNPAGSRKLRGWVWALVIVVSVLLAGSLAVLSRRSVPPLRPIAPLTSAEPRDRPLAPARPPTTALPASPSEADATNATPGAQPAVVAPRHGPQGAAIESEDLHELRTALTPTKPKRATKPGPHAPDEAAREAVRGPRSPGTSGALNVPSNPY